MEEKRKLSELVKEIAEKTEQERQPEDNPIRALSKKWEEFKTALLVSAKIWDSKNQ